MKRNKQLKQFSRNGNRVYLDVVRDVLIPVTPEETVRQNIVVDLLDNWGIPKDYIKVEENMSHYKKGARDRADIVVRHPKTKKPWVLFELKAPNVHICDDTLEQAQKYNKILQCKYICLSNSINTAWYVIEDDVVAISIPKTVKELLDNKYTYTAPIPYKGQAFERIISKRWIDGLINDFGVIGSGTPPEFHHYIANFDSFLMKEVTHIKEPIKCDDFTIIEDGIRNTSFGNVGGGSYDGLYRYYILEFKNGDHNIISLALFGTMKAVNHPHWGTRNSYTSLVVAIDDFDKKHNSLQLNIDKNLTFDEHSWYIHHDGKLTSGKHGACKISKVISFCKSHIPDLIDGNRFYLGKLPQGGLFTWDDSKEFVINLIRYALARDAFRKTIG